MIGKGAEQLGRAVLELDTDDKKLFGGIERARRGAISLGVDFAKVGGTLTGLVTGPLALFGGKALEAFRESRKAGAAVDQVLKSMGQTAGFTGEQLRQMASELQKQSNFDDDAILGKVSATLLTFGNVQGEVFRRAQQGALDLSAKLGIDLQSAAMLVGKALNNPLAGLTALTRAGVGFTAEQKLMIKEMMKAGEVGQAQALILSVLEKAYGGQARAARDADDGVTALHNQWGDFMERIGQVVHVVLPPLISILGSLVGWLNGLDDSTVTWIVTIGGIAAVVGPALVALGALVASVGALIPVITAVGSAMLTMLAATGPIGLLIAAAGILTAVWVKWGDDIKLAFTDAFEWIALTVDQMKLYLTTAFTTITDIITKPWRLMVEGAQKAYNVLVGNSIVPDMVVEITAWLNKLASNTQGSVNRITKVMVAGTALAADTSVDNWGKMFEAFGQFSSGMLRIARIYSAAQAFISTMAGAAEALKLPFPANLGAAAQVIGAGLSFVQAIKGTSVGDAPSSFTPTFSGGTSGGSTRVADAPGVVAGETARRLPQDVTINIRGSKLRKPDREEVEAMFQGLQEYFSEGARFKINWGAAS